MNRKEALKILELNDSSSDEEIKKAFKKLSVKYHPDRHQEKSEIEKADLSKKQQEINIAYQTLTNPQEDHNYGGFEHSDLEDLMRNMREHFSGVHGNVESIPPPIELKLKLTFEESVLGCSKEIKFNKKEKCQECHGKKGKLSKDNCDSCHGTGMMRNYSGNTVIQFTCPSCKGTKKKLINCEKCSATGVFNVEKSNTIKIPPGITEDMTLQMRGAGDYIPNIGYNNVLVHFDIARHTTLKRGKDDEILYDLNISLLEALQGSVKEVDTIRGKKEIIVPPLSKNMDLLKIPDCGVPPYGEQVISLHVEYPKNTEKLIQTLQEK